MLREVLREPDRLGAVLAHRQWPPHVGDNAQIRPVHPANQWRRHADGPHEAVPARLAGQPDGRVAVEPLTVLSGQAQTIIARAKSADKPSTGNHHICAPGERGASCNGRMRSQRGSRVGARHSRVDDRSLTGIIPVHAGRNLIL